MQTCAVQLCAEWLGARALQAQIRKGAWWRFPREGSEAALHAPTGSRTSSAAPAAGASWCQQGRGGGVWKACGCSYLEVSSPVLCLRQSIREGRQTLRRLERLYAKMPRVELSKKRLRTGPNKTVFSCAKPTNYQIWHVKDHVCGGAVTDTADMWGREYSRPSCVFASTAWFLVTWPWASLKKCSGSSSACPFHSFPGLLPIPLTPCWHCSLF